MSYKKTIKISRKKVTSRRKYTKKRNTAKKKYKLNKNTSKKNKKYIRKINSSTRKNKRKYKSMKKHKGGSEPSDQTLYNNDIEAIPLIIDNNSIDESELDDLEFELADNSFASHTPDTTINNSYDGETTKEDISDDEDDEDELNTGFHEN